MKEIACLEDLDEGLLSGLGKLAVKGLSKSPKVAGAMTRMATALSRPNAIKKLATTWADEIATTGNATSTTRDSIERIIGRDFANDAEVLKAAQSKVDDIIRAKQIEKGVAAVKQVAGKTTDILKKTGSGILGLAKTVGVAEPFYVYHKNMTAARERLDAGLDTPEQYEEHRKQQVGLLVSTVAAGFVGTKILKAPHALISKVLPSSFTTVHSLLSGATNAAQAAFLLYLGSQQGRTVLAQLLTGQIVEGAGYLTIEAGKKLAAAAEYATQRAEQGAKPTEPTKDAPQLRQEPTQQPASPNEKSLKTAEEGSWVDITPRIQQNTVTGKTRIKPF